MSPHRMIVRRVAPNGLFLVALYRRPESSDAERADKARALQAWAERAVTVAQRLRTEAAKTLLGPEREPFSAYLLRSRRAYALERGVREAIHRLVSLVR